MTTSLYQSVSGDGRHHLVRMCNGCHIQNEWVEQQSCIKFCIKLIPFSVETTEMILKAAASGNWWLAASALLRTHWCIMSHAEFFGETSNHPGDSAPYSPDLVPCTFWLCSKLKGKGFQTVSEIQETTVGQLMAFGRTVWGPKVPMLKGTEVSLSYVQCFLYLVSSSINVSFSYYMAGYLLNRPLMICL